MAPAKRPRTQTKAHRSTLFDAADTPPPKQTTSAAETKKFLESLDNDDDDDDDESLSDLDSDDFEDVAPARKKPKMAHIDSAQIGQDERANDDDDDDDDDDGMDWEDATTAHPNVVPSSKPDVEIADIDVSLNEDGVYVEPELSLATGKKGPSKRERQFRVLTHCLHVQSLMWHNTVRNSWLNDTEVQKFLVDGLGDGVKKEITRWRENMGILTKEELEAKKAAAAKLRARNEKKGKGKRSKTRDWSYEAEHLDQGVPNLSQGDPLLRLLKVLAAYWRKRFTVTAPAFRKQGYMPLKRLRDEIQHWSKNMGDADEHGERIENLDAFRNLAKSCEGSRDVGAQLFVALLRAIGLETRMVANLQPAGTGFSKAEEALEKKKKKEKKGVDTAMSEKEDDDLPSAKTSKVAQKATPTSKTGSPNGKSARGAKTKPINLEESGSELSELPLEAEEDDVSLVDITTPSSLPQKKAHKKYDRDLAFPTYWTEVCSPVSHKWIPVDPIVLSTIASTDELLQTFEPRGKKADMAKQVMCYTIAFSADGSAKDVTVRYLKKHQLPGKTRGMRIVAEKVPIYNKRGKVKKYENYDWFRTVMSSYDRPQIQRTAADDLEEQTDLKPWKPIKEAKEVEKESLQWYKQSAEFVLEQHLRREEAIVPGAKPVRDFIAGKGDKAVNHPVYKRSDVATCKTVESWHKEGREVKVGEHPMKHVPVRAVTLLRKREMEEHFKEHGEKLQQGLYSWDQTDWIIPPPIHNGVIPKNAFGNMDVYVDTMVPAGAVHLPLKGSAKICRKLEIDYAEACVGFEFGKQRAVPVLSGVVVAEEHEILVRDAWKEQQIEIKRKEDTKRTAAALHWWRKMVMGMRIVERMRAEYDETSGDPDASNPFARKATAQARHVPAVVVEEDVGAGGFFPPGHVGEESREHELQLRREAPSEDVHGNGSGGFFAESEDEGSAAGDGGFLVVEEGPDGDTSTRPSVATPFTPMSLQSVHQAPEPDEAYRSNGAGGFLVDNSDQEEEEEEEQAPNPGVMKRSRTASRAPAMKATRMAAKPAIRQTSARSAVSRKAPALTTPSSDSDLSELEDDEDPGNTGKPALAPLRRERSSPQVIISPVKKRATRAQSRTSNGKRATPVKSQYFEHDDNRVDEDENNNHDDEDDENDSEPEVVRPTRTTARTRNRR
ncbi:DNA repair protein [Sphaerulina musiva]